MKKVLSKIKYTLKHLTNIKYFLSNHSIDLTYKFCSYTQLQYKKSLTLELLSKIFEEYRKNQFYKFRMKLISIDVIQHNYLVATPSKKGYFII